MTILPPFPSAMTLRILSLFAFVSALTLPPFTRGLAQEEASNPPESESRSILSDPRLQNALRSAGQAKDKAVESGGDDPAALVDEAARLFRENISKLDPAKLDPAKLDTPENRTKAESIAREARQTAGEIAARPEAAGAAEALEAVREAGSEIMARAEMEAPEAGAGSEETGEASPARIETPPARVPATRPANAAVDFVRPIAMPTEEVPSRIASDNEPETRMRESSVPPLANTSPTTPRIPGNPLLTATEVPEPAPLRRRYFPGEEQSQRVEADGNHMIITAREVIMDDQSGILTFTGNVHVNDPAMGDLKCEILEVHTGGGGSPGLSSEGGPSFQKVIASGGMVEIKRVSAEGKTQIAMARRAEYDRTTGDMVLSGGPPYIQDGGSFVETNSPDAKIIMRGNGRYEVTGSDAGPKNRTRIVIPVDGPDKTKDIGIGGGLGGGFDRLR